MVLYCIGVLKSDGLAAPIVSVEKFTNVGSNYHLTINTQRCLYFPSRMSKLQSGLIQGFSFVQTDSSIQARYKRMG